MFLKLFKEQPWYHVQRRLDWFRIICLKRSMSSKIFKKIKLCSENNFTISSNLFQHVTIKLLLIVYMFAPSEELEYSAALVLTITLMWYNDSSFKLFQIILWSIVFCQTAVRFSSSFFSSLSLPHFNLPPSLIVMLLIPSSTLPFHHPYYLPDFHHHLSLTLPSLPTYPYLFTSLALPLSFPRPLISLNLYPSFTFSPSFPHPPSLFTVSITPLIIELNNFDLLLYWF